MELPTRPVPPMIRTCFPSRPDACAMTHLAVLSTRAIACDDRDTQRELARFKALFIVEDDLMWTEWFERSLMLLDQPLAPEPADTARPRSGEALSQDCKMVRMCCLCEKERAVLRRPKTFEQVQPGPPCMACCGRLPSAARHVPHAQCCTCLPRDA